MRIIINYCNTLNFSFLPKMLQPYYQILEVDFKCVHIFAAREVLYLYKHIHYAYVYLNLEINEIILTIF